MEMIFRLFSDIYTWVHDRLINPVVHVTEIFFSSNYVYLILFIVCFVLLIKKRKEMPEGYVLLGLYSSIVLPLIYFLWLFDLFNIIPFSGDAVFARLWLLCPVWLVLSYAMVVYVCNINTKHVKYLVILGLSLLLVLSGASIRSLSMVNTPQNLYKIRSESIEIADQVLRLNNGEPTSLFMIVPYQGVEDNYVNGGTINMGIEQYTSEIQLTAFKLSEEDWNNFFLSETTPTNLDSEDWIRLFISQRYENTYADYFALPTNDILNSRLSDLGYEWQSDVAGYSIYRFQ